MIIDFQIKRFVLVIFVFIELFCIDSLYASVFKVERTIYSDEKGLSAMSYTLQNGNMLIYHRPKSFRFVGTLPKDYSLYFKKTFKKEQAKNFGIILGSTMLLYAFDEQFLHGAKDVGSFVNIPGTSHQMALINSSFKLGKQSVPIQFNVPTDLNSVMYFLGDGWTHTTIALSFWVSGLISKDYRELQTASQLGECILATGIATQFIKHITGRESPYTTNTPRGVWRFFPNQKDYASHVPNHDAYPTGHLATAMATVNVIAENYPEKRFIRPVGYSLMGLLGFAMLNNGVHWASDYPLGIALGYSFAKIAVSQGRTVKKEEGCQGSLRWKYKPELFPAFQMGIPEIGFRLKLAKK